MENGQTVLLSKKSHISAFAEYETFCFSEEWKFFPERKEEMGKVWSFFYENAFIFSEKGLSYRGKQLNWSLGK